MSLIDPLEELLSEGIDINNLIAEPVDVDTVTLHNNSLDGDAAQSQVAQSRALMNSEKPTIAGRSSNQVEIAVNSTSSKTQHPENDGNPEQTPGKLKIEEQVAEFTRTSENKMSLNQTVKQQFIAPVKEVNLATLKKNSVKQFPVANIFEKRFARKFLIEYLDSIEKGNMSQINNFLSSSLVIDGVANNKGNYLKNTYELIDQTTKRQYNVQFIGDVLRLDPGVFRVTVTLNHTYVFKNYIVSKKTAQKQFDIKRYSNGSEIINISSA